MKHRIYLIILFLLLAANANAQSTTTTNMGIPKPNAGSTLPSTISTVQMAFDKIDMFVTNRLSKSVAGNVDIALTMLESCNAMLEFNGAINDDIYD